jgi:hypothetical protein
MFHIHITNNIVINSTLGDNSQQLQALPVARQVDSDKGDNWTRIRACFPLALKLLSIFIFNNF